MAANALLVEPGAGYLYPNIGLPFKVKLKLLKTCGRAVTCNKTARRSEKVAPDGGNNLVGRLRLN